MTCNLHLTTTKCITYVCSYFTKDETECSQAIMNAAKEANKENLSVRDSLKRIGAAFFSTREVSSQECLYRCKPELWLRNISVRGGGAGGAAAPSVGEKIVLFGQN